MTGRLRAPAHTLVALLCLAAGFLGGAAVLARRISLPPLDTVSRVQLAIGVVLAGMILAVVVGCAGLLLREAGAPRHRRESHGR
jgi:hypothetical protein